MSKPTESDIIKNLNPQEKRRLMRQLESNQSSPKKKIDNSRPVSSKNSVPKPFTPNAGARQQNNASNKPKSAASTRWGGNFVAGRDNEVVVPKLNQDHVKMFNAQEAANKFQDIFKNPEKVKSPPKPESKASPSGKLVQKSSSPNFAMPPKNEVKQGRVGAVKSVSPPAAKSSSQAAKVAPATKSVAQVTKPPTQVSKPAAQVSKPQATKPVAQATKPVAQVTKPIAQATKPMAQATKPMAQATKPMAQATKPISQATKPVAKVSEAVSQAKPSAENRKPLHNEPKRSEPSKPPQAKAPATPWQRPPLSKDKIGSPPTAVVAPLNSNASNKSNKPSNPSDNARQRSVSSPVNQPKKSHGAVSYKSSEDNVVLPELSPKMEDTKSQRSLSVSEHAKGDVVKLGHHFEPYELKDWVNWCDACGSVILSLFGKCVHCTKCRMVCHGKCSLTVSLTCEADQPHLALPEVNLLTRYKTIVQETKDESTLKEYNTIHRVLSVEEIQEKIENFNQTVKGSQQMTLQDDGETFRGFIRVSMNLMRPVSVLDNLRTKKSSARKASFYIEKGALKALHLTSDTTSEQVVQALLNKYSITDNPMKFALFEKQVREEGHVILRKMLQRERPLFLRLLWGNGNNDKRGFILQENESRDIHWESFSIAELLMFIKILDKEEGDYIAEIKRKYRNKAQDIRNAIEYQNKNS